MRLIRLKPNQPLEHLLKCEIKKQKTAKKKILKNILYSKSATE